MPHEIASNILAEQPMDPVVAERLHTQHIVGYDRLDEMHRNHQSIILMGLDDIESMLVMSRPEELDPVQAYHDDPVSPRNAFEQLYDDVRHEPVEKFKFDREYIDEFMRKLGPTNVMRRVDGLDSSFELARMRRLLQNDYDALPEAEKRLELRMTEALIAEEIALLWTPTALGKIARAPEEHKSFIADPQEVNIDASEYVGKLSDADRWKLAGAQLSGEAAEIFREIAASSTVSAGDKYEAICRATDMEIRQLRIEGNMAVNKSRKVELEGDIKKLAYATLQTMVNAWENQELRDEIDSGRLYELIVVVDERRKLLKANMNQQLVRLAVPREDKVHERLGPIRVRDKKLSLSSDVIVEDVSQGTFVTSYQAKSVDARIVDLNQELKMRQGGRRERVYDTGRIALRTRD